MDKAGKQVGSCSSSSSFTVDLFGPKESSKSSSSSSTGLFGSIFGPPTSTLGPGRDMASRTDFGRAYGNDKHEPTDCKTQKGDPIMIDKNSKYDQNGRGEPCYFSSSIYYGGQEVYSPTNRNNNSPPHNIKKDGGDDTNESNSSCASRGNWWKGSLYY